MADQREMTMNETHLERYRQLRRTRPLMTNTARPMGQDAEARRPSLTLVPIQDAPRFARSPR